MQTVLLGPLRLTFKKKLHTIPSQPSKNHEILNKTYSVKKLESQNDRGDCKGVSLVFLRVRKVTLVVR